MNAGSWTFSRAFVTTAGDSPYWPGTYVLVEDNGPPVVTRLLLDRTLAQVEPSRRRRGS